ncbi:phospholipid-binding lipoprotein MlaA [Tamilnaduibacter salinus]|uniref:Phospholipid-binding lipoprotein MlaA n=1 Tax=Tamilnaduibacter salinus TaxID=1484056 RepID=A0A2A2I7I7_9GAMM|nr:hypothetical protein CF392_02360 [Tamilnaduibacter salinus]PVY78272.1 phospholipid-binding lipoprotein MlaA [Tamilnaduibacter salinus]
MRQAISRAVLMASTALLLAGPLHAQDAPEEDPYEDWNRDVYEFNVFVDTWFLKPVAKAYRFVTPDLVDQAITNVFANLGEAENLLNSMLQGKLESSVVAVGRFTYNTTFGLGGLIDVATVFGIPERPEDLGQTLGYWGMDSGPYIMLPFLGPSTGRDAAGLAGEFAVMPSSWDYIEEPEHWYLRGLQIVDTRADLIAAEGFLGGGDDYSFIRNAYLQRREYLINDGKIEKDPFTEGDDDLMLEDF